MLKLKLNILATWCEEQTYVKRPWFWERLKAGAEGKDRGWDGWMDSMDMSLSKLQELAMDREDCSTVVHGITKSWTWLRDWTELAMKWWDKLSDIFVFLTLSFKPGFSLIFFRECIWLCFFILLNSNLILQQTLWPFSVFKPWNLWINIMLWILGKWKVGEKQNEYSLHTQAVA